MATNKLVCVEDYQKLATSLLGGNERDYLNPGVDDEITLKWNTLAFKRLCLFPRVLRDVTTRNMKTTVLGEEINIPICISPMAYVGSFQHEGETGVAKATQKVGTLFTMSSMATESVETVQSNVPDCLKWFQVYVSEDRRMTEDNIKRAAKTGFKALIFTVDLPVTGKRRCIARKPFVLPPHLTAPMYSSYYGSSGIPGVGDVTAKMSWDMISWMKEVSGLPVIVKGIMTAEDAELAIQHGADAIIVSNHGGRQLDTVPAAIDLLPGITEAVQGRVEVYLDGGIRTGTDVFKALALGARAVFVGRPVVWGLVCKGSQGVVGVLEILAEELSTAMALTGCRDLKEINKNLVARMEFSRL